MVMFLAALIALIIGLASWSFHSPIVTKLFLFGNYVAGTANCPTTVTRDCIESLMRMKRTTLIGGNLAE